MTRADETAAPTTEPVVAPRKRLVGTTDGTVSGAFGGPEWGLLAALAFIWGSSFLWMDYGLDAFAPGVVTLARVGLGALALVAIPRARTPVEREDWPQIVLLGVIWTGIPLTLFPIAQQWIDSSLAGMINAGVPLTSAVWATILLRRLPGRAQLTGILVGFAGVALLSAPKLAGADATALGTALVLLAVILYGLATNMAVPLQQRYGSLPVILRMQLVAILVVLPYGLYGLPRSTFAWGSALAMLPLGMLGTGVAFVLMTTLVGRVGGPRGSISIYFVPIVAIALGVIFRDEAVATTSLVGTALIIVGAWIASRAEARRPPR